MYKMLCPETPNCQVTGRVQDSTCSSRVWEVEAGLGDVSPQCPVSQVLSLPHSLTHTHTEGKVSWLQNKVTKGN